MDIGHALSHVPAEGSHLVGEGGRGLPDSAFGCHLLGLNQFNGALNKRTVGGHLGGGLQHGLTVTPGVLGAGKQVFLHTLGGVFNALGCYLNGLAAQAQPVFRFLDRFGHLFDGTNNASGVNTNALISSHEGIFLRLKLSSSVACSTS